MTLIQTIAALRKAGLDTNIEGLLDALWLARTEGFNLYGESPPVEAELEGGPKPGKEREGAGANTGQPGAGPTKTSDSAPPRIRPKAGSETGVYPQMADTSGEMVKASPVRIPAGAALPGKLKLARALRPLLQKSPSPHLLELDEEATVDATARLDGRLSPVFRPRRERWYEATLVIEDAPSMDVWHRTLEEFRQTLQETGAFSDVRVWRLKPGPAPSAMCASGASSRDRRQCFKASQEAEYRQEFSPAPGNAA